MKWYTANAHCRVVALEIAVVVASILSAAGADGLPTSEAIKEAGGKSLPLLEAAAKGSMEERNRCFTCHNQGLPIMALVTARTRGLAIDDAHLQTQLQFTADFLTKNKER